MVDERFFDEAGEQSLVKTAIVAKYFQAWSQVMLGTLPRRGGDRIAYIDLFSGRGRYKDGTKSTPLLVLERAIANDRLRDTLVTVFNDSDPEFCRQLQHEIDSLDGVGSLRFRPQVLNGEVDQELADHLLSVSLVPSLFFIDPWGYRGLSRQLIDAAVKDWGCDCIFFFNYRRINAGLSNKFFQQRMAAIFGDDLATSLGARLAGLSPDDRELTIVEQFSQMLSAGSGGERRYVLPFRFRTETGARTSHHLIFVSKHFLGYDIMKEIMAGESSTEHQGIPSFDYSPADACYPTLFSLNQPFDSLHEQLRGHFAGRCLQVAKIYEEHSPGTPYIRANYKQALVRLEADDRVTMNPPADRRPMRNGLRTCSDRVLVSFPKGARDGQVLDRVD